jgi:hypothetical protein
MIVVELVVVIPVGDSIIVGLVVISVWVAGVDELVTELDTVELQLFFGGFSGTFLVDCKTV